MPCSSPDIHQKSFRIKHDDDKFFTRLLSKESSKSNPSFRVYYGDVPIAVPFVWETRPGTPKHASCDSFPIPPLTPPPSHYANQLSNPSKKHSRSKLLLHTLLRRMNPQKPQQYLASSLSPSPSSSSLSGSSSSRSLFYDPTATPTYAYKRRRFSSWGSSLDHRAWEDHRVDEVWPSKLWFGIGKEKGDRFHGGSHSVLVVKKALLSIVGCGSA